MTAATLDLDRLETLATHAQRVSLESERVRKFLAHWDWLAGFPVTFLPVLYADLRRRGVWTPELERRAMLRVKHRLGAFPEAGEFSAGVPTDAQGFLGMEEALLAGLRPEDFRQMDRDGDGRVHYRKELLPRVAVRLLHEGLFDREQYARVLAAR